MQELPKEPAADSKASGGGITEGFMLLFQQSPEKQRKVIGTNPAGEKTTKRQQKPRGGAGREGRSCV